MPSQTLPVDDRVALTFASSAPHATCWIEMTYPIDAVPQGLLDDLAAAGFAVDGRYRPAPPYTPILNQGAPGQPTSIQFADYQVVDVLIGAPRGSALFGGWTPGEKRTHMAAARRVLRNHGFTDVPVWKKTLQDML